MVHLKLNPVTNQVKHDKMHVHPHHSAACKGGSIAVHACWSLTCWVLPISQTHSYPHKVGKSAWQEEGGSIRSVFNPSTKFSQSWGHKDVDYLSFPQETKKTTTSVLCLLMYAQSNGIDIYHCNQPSFSGRQWPLTLAITVVNLAVACSDSHINSWPTECLFLLLFHLPTKYSLCTEIQTNILLWSRLQIFFLFSA